ncbi:MAG: ABC transporter ATP-binding protein [Actinomycetota bacterium]|nr:ABC transporter ATP-binding protein [Actinomycetota bacterium]
MDAGVPLVRLDAVGKSYGDRQVLRDVHIDLHRGEMASLTGPSGSGKSTLISLLAGLSVPDAGRMLFDGVEINELDDAGRARLRARRIGIILQSGNLIPFLTASENVELAHRFADHRRGAQTRDLLAELGVADRSDHLPRRMSGGQAQRVAVAVALANEPDLLLADEVTGQLDTATADQVMRTILEAGRRHGLTVLFVTHDRELAARAERRLVLEAGQVYER